jgi:drug/metabolite transporter (DMT)-like permease
LSHPAWLWIAVTVWAAFAQTVRNAAQRHLTAELGTLGATLVRFLYGLPYAVLFLVAAKQFGASGFPDFNLKFLAWVLMGALAQTAATALLLRVMQERNFALGVAYSKSEILQVAVFGVAFLGDPLTLMAMLAVLAGTVGVLMISPPKGSSFSKKAALLGLASGAGFALSAVGYRGAALALDTNFLMAAAYTLVWAQLLSTLVLGGWLCFAQIELLKKVFAAWRFSQLAGFMGAAASAGWFTAFAIEPAAHVRTLGLVELVFSYLVSRRIFRERLSWMELGGMAMLAVGVALITLRPDPQPVRSKAPAASAWSYVERGLDLASQGRTDEALAEFGKASTLAPTDPRPHTLAGFAWFQKKNEYEALKELLRGVDLGAPDPRGHNAAAWILATSRDNSLRDGRRAVELARQACEMTGWREAAYIDTLAAAYAEIGDFPEAVRWQEKALAMPALQYDREAKERLELFRNGKPWRADPA